MPNQLPPLPGHTHVAPDADQLFDDLANVLMGAAIQAVQARGVFHLAVSGGKSPEPFFVRLVADPRFRGVPWKRAHIWMVDERRVPVTDERSNWKMIRETLADHVGVRRRQNHPMPVDGPDPAGRYEEELRSVIALGAGSIAGAVGDAPPDAVMKVDAIPRLDLVLLGMGDDGHTASLFPHSDALRESTRLVAINDGPHVTPPPRITMTYPLLNAARKVAVLVTGEKKTPALLAIAQQVQKVGPDPDNFPITGIHPADGDLTWFLDAAAAGDEPDAIVE